jgi:GT2 family glycosyltransferase
MGKPLNVSIVIYKNDFAEIAALVKNLRSFQIINNIYLIDNSPSPGPFFKSLHAEYIFPGCNLGYGGGHNLAIQQSIRDTVSYHLVLNPDVFIRNGEILNELFNYMEENPDVGLVMPSVKFPDGQQQYLCKLLASPFDLIGRRFLPFERLIRERNYKYELRFTRYNRIMEVPSLSGCFMFLRTNVLKTTGGFDERFFMYLEDNDLSRRVGQVSKTMFYPHVSVIHEYKKGSYKNPKLLIYHITSAIKYFNKWGWMFDHEKKKMNHRVLTDLGFYDRHEIRSVKDLLRYPRLNQQ